MPKHKRKSDQYGGTRPATSYRSRSQSQARRGDQRKGDTSSSRTDTSSNRNTSKDDRSEAAGSSSVLEIPGFHYDPEKKRYFKIAPNHATGNCNYTKQSIATKAAEQKRQSDVSDLLSNKTCSEHYNHKDSLLHLIYKRPLNGVNKQIIQRKMLRQSITGLKPVDSQLIFENPRFINCDNIEHMLKMHVAECHSELLCLWSMRGNWIHRIQLLGLEECTRTDRQSSLSCVAKPILSPVIPQMQKVTDMCWAPIRDNEKHVLYTTMCYLGIQESLAIIKVFGDGDTAMYQDYSLGIKATWTCAWNKPRCQFSVGTEKSVLVLNAERRTMWEYNTNKSDPLALTFSHQNGNCLYTGTRRGEILLFDMRSRSTFPTCTLKHKSSVCSVKLVHNDMYVIGSDFTGKICLWDVRKKSVVLQYEGNVNLYTQLPVHVDETETILYTVGEDGYTRFWDLKDGRQLYTIPPPCSVSRETIPCVQMSTRWGNREGNTGLVMALKDKLHYYGTLPLG